ncbi:kif6 type kinesin-like protein [Nannochloropsis oceanica]
MSSISFRSMQDRRVLTSTGGNTNRSSLSVGEGSPRATITCTTPGSSKVAHRRSAQKHTEQECMKQKEKDETMLEEPVKKNRQKKRTTWRVETFCRIKPQVNSSSPSAKHFRSIPYELRHGQGPLGADPPHRRLRIGVAGSGTGGMAFNSRRQEMDFSFTEVFPPAITQDQVYHRVASAVVDSVLHGYNGTIFAYGQTGSGKTFTMTGGDSFDERGLIPRAITDVYDTIRQTPDRRFKVLISYMEIYKESAYDLLDVSTRTKPLEGWTKIQMMDDEDGEMNLRNLKLYEATSEEDALNLLFLGNWHRITSSTPMNEASTRSHCIFTIRIQADPLLHGIPNRPSKSTFGKLNLVDLAGSERLFKTDNHQSSSSSSSGSGLAASNYTRMEGKYINLSLHYLEQVIIALQEKARRQKDEDEEGQGRPGLVRGSSSSSFTSSSLYPSSPSSYHIPYRNSVMTSILRDSLGGNCRTVFVVTLNTELDHLEESLSTCRFAQRCAQLSTDVLANEEVNPDQLTASLQAEVLRLRRKISAQETALATALTQTQEEESKNAWRGLTGAEKHLCRDVVRGFVQVASSLPASPPSSPPSGPLSVPPHYEWIYTLARPLVAYCARLLLLWGEAVREEGRKEKKEGVMKYQQEQWKRHQRLEQAHHHQHRSSVGERPTSGFALLQQQQQQQQREPDAQITPHIHTSLFATAAPTAPLSIASPHQEGKEAEAEAEARNEGRRVRGLLQQGHVFFKLGKGERKHERFVWVALDMTRLHWRKERKGEKKGGNKGEDEGEHKNGNPPISSSFLVLSDCQRVAAGRDGERGEKEGKREEEKGVFFTLYSHDRYVTFETLTRSKASRPAMNLAVHPVPREEQKMKEAGHRREEGKEGDLCHQHHHRQQHKEVKEGEEEMIRQQQVGQQQQRYSPPLGLFATEHLDQEQRQEYHSSSIPSLSLPPSEEPSRSSSSTSTSTSSTKEKLRRVGIARITIEGISSSRNHRLPIAIQFTHPFLLSLPNVLPPAIISRTSRTKRGKTEKKNLAQADWQKRWQHM